ncbi:MAG UNVERIFIED_CONTAM: hypothetical protein LVQ98_04890 [Rickettsiaceae bacterium]|jgi:hypothetical protein
MPIYLIWGQKLHQVIPRGTTLYIHGGNDLLYDNRVEALLSIITSHPTSSIKDRAALFRKIIDEVPGNSTMLHKGPDGEMYEIDYRLPDNFSSFDYNQYHESIIQQLKSLAPEYSDSEPSPPLETYYNLLLKYHPGKAERIIRKLSEGIYKASLVTLNNLNPDHDGIDPLTAGMGSLLLGRYTTWMQEAFCNLGTQEQIAAEELLKSMDIAIEFVCNQANKEAYVPFKTIKYMWCIISKL